MKVSQGVRGNIGRWIWSALIITAGCAVSAVGISIFLVPNRIAPGGVTGLATIIYHWSGLPVGTAALVINVPLFLIGFRLVGSGFGIKTIAATIILSLFINLTADIPPVTDDLLLAALAGGTLMGLGIGPLLRRNATTGGTDMAAWIIHKHFRGVSMAQVLMGIDVLVVLASAAAFRSYELPLYAGVTVVITSKVIETVTVGVNFAKAAHIISSRPDAVASRLLGELNRGVTGLKARGLYTGEGKEVLVCVLTARQVPFLRHIVKETDPGAFVYISDTREVFGEGFQPHD